MHEKPCPKCGHCPTCGRSNVSPYSVWPWYPRPYWPNAPFYVGDVPYTQPYATWTAADTQTTQSGTSQFSPRNVSS